MQMKATSKSCLPFVLLGCVLTMATVVESQTVKIVGEETFPVDQPGTPSGFMGCNIPFAGEASGGTLVLASTMWNNHQFIEIKTAPGESATSVAQRLSEAYNGALRLRAGTTSSEGVLQRLSGGCENYMLAGSETGLGIPPPPTSLTCNYDSDSDTLSLHWINPSDATYDFIRIVCASTGGGLAWLPRTAEQHVIDWGTMKQRAIEWHQQHGERMGESLGPIEMMDIRVVGVCNNIPSNAAAVHVHNHVQQEVFGVPFARNTAPNWTAWSLHGDAAPYVRVSGFPDRMNKWSRPGRRSRDITPETKPFFQVITGGGTAGITRSFLGLTPGHAYRITVRMSTLVMARKPRKELTDWSYSFHAIPAGPQQRTLSAEQMAGLVPLPDGSDGPAAGRVVEYNHQKVTESVMGAQMQFEENTTDIMLPPDTDSIIVWLRFTSPRVNDRMAMDYIRLEDLGPQ